MGTAFTKLQGIGNDFIAIDGRQLDGLVDGPLSRRLCDRHAGIGADGVLLFTGTLSAPRMIVFNADGSRAGMCGNGIRCFARWLAESFDLSGKRIDVATDSGQKVCGLLRDAAGQVVRVSVDMGTPTLAPEGVPVASDQAIIGQPISVSGRQVTMTAVGTGNPHGILFEPFSLAERQQLGPAIAALPLFPAGVNVGFCELLEPGPDASRLRSHVYERGCGWTLACGTGATAAAFAALELNLVPSGRPVDVRLPGGWLRIEITDEGQAIMTGDAVEVFRGEVDLGRFVEPA
jgi:diaminopimelate epimerase